MDSNKFVILGIHGPEVLTVSGDLIRVRMYVGGAEYDEDFSIPVSMPPGVDKKEPQVYEWFLKDAIEARMKELEVQPK